MFTQITNSARAFVREFKNNEHIRLVRSEVQFKKYAELEGIELKSLRGNIEGTLKKRVAVWSKKAAHGIICDLRDYNKFEKFCDETEEDKEPTKRGRKPTVETLDTPKVRGKKSSEDKTHLIEETEDNLSVIEPDIEFDVHCDFEQKHNDKEFLKVLKSELKRLGVSNTIEGSDLLKILKQSQNMRDLLLYIFPVYKLNYELPKNIK